MPLQDPNFFGLVDPSNPKGTDTRTISDDYHRMILQSLKNQAGNWTGAINATHLDVNLLTGIQAAGAKLLTGNGGSTVAYRWQNTADIGWTIEEPDVNIRELVIGPAVSGGTVGGSIDPTNLTQTATVTVSSLSGNTDAAGGHDHDKGTLSADEKEADYNSLAGGVPLVTTQAHGHSISGKTGAEHDHVHGLTGVTGAGTADVSIAPRYARGILQKLDA